MNRQIKFRIWDKQNKKWIENSSSLYCFSRWTICPFTGNVADYVGDYNCDHFTSTPAADYYWEDGKLIKEPRYVIQQYTGLKDKNGKEIYEGDILTCKYADQEVTEAISYSEDYSSFTHGEHVLWRGWIGEAEIIGNIMQNPELIKNNE
jgi:uncharacterized phage protein (TIGR01671 family)